MATKKSSHAKDGLPKVDKPSSALAAFSPVVIGTALPLAIGLAIAYAVLTLGGASKAKYEARIAAVAAQELEWGYAAAALVGYGALKVLLGMVKKGRLYVFAPYCWLVGILAILFSW